MSPWQGYRFHRLIQVLHDATEDRDQPERARDEAARSLLAGLAGTHASLRATGDPGAGLMTAWVRPARDQPLHLLLGGRPYFPPATGQASGKPPSLKRGTLFPAGAVVADLPDGVVPGLLADFGFWVACSGRSDALWAAVEPRAPKVPARGAFDQHVTHLGKPFAWLVVAEPLQPAEIKPELDSLVNDILPLTRGEISETKRVSLERKQARHRELSRSQVGGLWRIRILVGGRSPRDAEVVAAMLCAASDLDGLPYALTPAIAAAPLTVALSADTRDDQGNETPFTATTELLVALVKPPARELPGVRLAQPHAFDVTPEDVTPQKEDTAAPGGLPLGSVLDEALAEVGQLTLGTESLNRHSFVCGATGAGKTYTVRHLLEQASKAGIPWLVIEPAKAEYAAIARRLALLGQPVFVLRPNHPERPPAGINPMQPAAGFPLQTHADLLRALFLAAFEPYEPFPQILASALTRCYQECGWDLMLGEPAQPGHKPRYPTLDDLQQVAEATVSEIGYGPEVASNVRGFIKVRLASLRLGTTGSIFSGGHPLDFHALRARNVVLEIEDVGDDTDKAFLMGTILMRLVEELRVAKRSGAMRRGLSHLTVVEEAHRLLRRPDPGASGTAAHAVEMFASLLAEVRAYGEGLIIAEQIPSKLIPDVIKNTAVKITHRLPAIDDRDSVGATMNLDQAQSRYLVTLPPGEGAVFTDGMDRAVLVRVPEIKDGTDALAAPLSELIGRRSATCGPDCRAEPCTLRQMRAAQRLIGAERWFVMWAELTVLAHLAGHPAPVPSMATLGAFRARALPAREADCAISQAVDDAVAVRSGSLLPVTDPAELAAHVCTALRRMLDGADHGCQADANRYVCAPYAWELIRAALATDAGTPDTAPHPRTSEWERKHGRKIPGSTCAEQLAVVTSWPDADFGDKARRDAVSYGTRRPSAIESVLGAAEGWTGRLEATLQQFPGCTWPQLHLTPPPGQPSE